MQYLTILRGINVGGKRKMLMADLKQLFIDKGFTNVVSYIQSGNIIFETNNNIEVTALESILEMAIKEQFSYDVPVIVREIEAFKNAIIQNPFTKGKKFDIERLHLTFLGATPEQGLHDELAKVESGNDKFQIIDNHAFVYCSAKYSESKLTNQFFERKLKTKATTRNWKSITRLMELASK